jgi:hypothetical protein
MSMGNSAAHHTWKVTILLLQALIEADATEQMLLHPLCAGDLICLEL